VFADVVLLASYSTHTSPKEPKAPEVTAAAGTAVESLLVALSSASHFESEVSTIGGPFKVVLESTVAMSMYIAHEATCVEAASDAESMAALLVVYQVFMVLYGSSAVLSAAEPQR